MALEIASSWGQADGAAGSTPLNPCDEPCQPALGRTADAWRTPQARNRRRADECDEVYGAQEATTVSGSSQGWRTFLRNHADGIVAMEFVVPTISFQLLYGLLILRHDRRRILWMGVTAHPTAEWIARQLTEACGWDQAPTYLLRDRDQVYGQAFTRRIRAMGIRDQPTSPRSPWQNAYAERLIGSIRRECVDHIVVFGERHLRHALLSYMNYYNEVRTHLSLGKDAPVSRVVHAVGQIPPRPILGGLHHEYVRI